MQRGITRILKRSSGRDVLAVRKAVIKVVRGPDRGRKVELGDSTAVLIGTEPSAALPLTDDSISRRHAEVSADAAGYVLRDLGSTNGIRIAGMLVREGVLSDRTTFSLGESDLKFELLQGEVEHELSDNDRFGSILGASPVMRKMFSVLERAARSDATVLLEGESGTGKEEVAHSIHQASARAERRFVTVDCSAIPSNLAESELFGHEKGAFTGAHEARTGAFRDADGGTLFLDEIGELALEMQPRFLRALDQRQVKPVGGAQSYDVDVRVIAATNRDLSHLVSKGKFRADLYHRLAVVQVQLPALRFHPEDIPALARHFASELRSDMDPGELLAPSVLGALTAYAWPGNVRELRNVVERMVTLGDLAEPLRALSGEKPMGSYQLARKAALDQFEREYCLRTLEECGGVVVRAAERAGLSRQMYYRLLQKHGITP